MIGSFHFPFISLCSSIVLFITVRSSETQKYILGYNSLVEFCMCSLLLCDNVDFRINGFFNFRFHYCISIIISFTEWKVSITFLIDIEIIPVSPVLHRNILFNIFPYLLQREGRYSLFRSPQKKSFFRVFCFVFYLAARFLGYQGKTCLK